MAIVVTKSEERLKPVIFLKNAKAWWITLADKAANWTPWASKNDQNGGENMAGEVIQAVIAPLTTDLNELKELLGEELWARLQTEKAEKHDDCQKFTLADEARFVKLDAVEVEKSGVKLVYGQLKEASDARKADEKALIPFESRWRWQGEMPAGMEPFRDAVREELDRLCGKVITLVSLNKPLTETEPLIMDEVAAFGDWLTESLKAVEAAQKTDDHKPTFWDRLRGRTGRGVAQKTDNGGHEMEITEDKLQELMTNAASTAAKATVDAMVQKAETETASKAEQDAAAEREAAQKARDERIDKMLDIWEKQQAEKSEGGDEKPDDEVAKQIKEAMDFLTQTNDQVKALANKLEGFLRSPGASAPEDDGKQKETLATKTEDDKADTTVFNTMFTHARA